MKKSTLLITLIAFYAIIFAVTRKKSATTMREFDRVQEQNTDTTWQMKDYVYAQKDEFILNMKTRLAGLTRDLDQFKDRIERSGDVIKADAKPKIDALLAQIEVLNKQLNRAVTATESTWDSAKGDIRAGYLASKNDYQQASQWLSEKIAPESQASSP